MIRPALAIPADMPTQRKPELNEDEQARLIRAIESAIDVRRPEQFHAWMSGPFHALLPHEAVVCLDLGEGAAAQQVACLHHNLIDADRLDGLCHPEHGLAVRLARACGAESPTGHVIDGAALGRVACEAAADSDTALPDKARNAVIHRVSLLSGATYTFLLVNIPADQADRCHHLLKLLSSHLKMVLARAHPAPQARPAVPLTLREREILACMEQGRSNREISLLLGINPITLKHHISKVYRKLDVQSRAEAVARARPADAAGQ